ncbi:MAG TPA: hypothetical protein VFW85_07280 [Gaiellaceae bacterium]|nr:hypothetical protein [Gaiellaceae bacterium]
MTTTTHAAPIPDADDELLTQIIARRKRRTPLLTLALAVAVAAAAAFVGGVETQKHFGTKSSSGGGNANLAALASRFAKSGSGGRAGTFFSGRGANGGGAPAFLGGNGGGATVGTVTLIKGNDLYVTDSSGNTTVVHAKSARVTKSVTGSVKSIAPGDTVTIVGTQGSNGSTTARSITVNGNG